MTRRTLRARLEAAEVRRAKFDREHIPAPDVGHMLRAVLEVVGEEAGEDCAANCAGRLLEAKEARVFGLLSGMTSAQLEDVARRVGCEGPDLRGLSAPQLLALYFGKVTT